MTGGIELDLTLPLDRFELRLSLRLAARACAVIGPSGAGKSSLLESIAGLRPRARGRIAVDGEVLLDTARGVRLPPERRRIGWVPQDGALFPHLDVLGNLRFAARPGGTRLLDDAVDLLELRPLFARYPATLSGGERQRVALGRALAASPRLLLADEPLAALDAPLRERVLPLFTALRDRGQLRMLYVTHHLGEAQALDGEALLIRDGALEAHGPVAEVLTAARLSALDPAARFDNLVAGRVTARDDADGTARLELDSGATLSVPASGLTVGARAQFALPAEDLLLAIHPLDGISARNVLPATVTAIDPLAPPGGAIVRLDAAGLPLRARLTGGAVTALALAPGRAVYVAAKAHSFRRLL